MNNNDFLEVIRKSFEEYLKIGTSRSTAKLKILHGEIAKDLEKRLGSECYIKSQGYRDDKEGIIEGKYYPKNVDITIYNRNNKPVAGYAVKFVMRNYSQNSNNYFENMLGETANIRSNSIPYFQIFVTFDKVPYFQSGGKFKKYDIISKHHLNKYIELSHNNPNTHYHIPNKTLIVIVHLKEKKPNYIYKDSKDYADYHLSVINDNDFLNYSDKMKDDFSQILFFNHTSFNNYDKFINESVNIIKDELKKPD